jgi:hypothetical protein
LVVVVAIPISRLRDSSTSLTHYDTFDTLSSANSLRIHYCIVMQSSPLTLVPRDIPSPHSRVQTERPLHKTAGSNSPAVELSLKLVTPPTLPINRVRSPMYCSAAEPPPEVIQALFRTPPPLPNAPVPGLPVADLLNAQARRIDALEHHKQLGAARLLELENSVQRLLRQLNDSLPDLSKLPKPAVLHSSEDSDSSAQPVVHEPSFYESAHSSVSSQASRAASTAAASADELPDTDTSAVDNGVNLEQLDKDLRLGKLWNKRCNPPQSVRVPYPTSPCHYCESPDALGRHHWTNRCPHKAPCCHCKGDHSLRNCPDAAAPAAPPRPKRLHHTKKQPVPGPIAAHSATPTKPSQTDKDEPQLKKLPQLQLCRSACIVKGCKTTVSTNWWCCPDTRVHADARGPPDGNPHRNDFVCDACHDLWPELKGTFSRL